MRDKVNFIYMLFVTPIGKGYGCFAIKPVYDNGKTYNNVFKVAASFCHPNDRSKFSKKLARKIAEGKLEKYGAEFVFEKDLKMKNEAIVMRCLEVNSISIPSWVRKAFDINAYRFKLSLDRFNNNTLIYDMKLAEPYYFNNNAFYRKKQKIEI